MRRDVTASGHIDREHDFGSAVSLSVPDPEAPFAELLDGVRALFYHRLNHLTRLTIGRGRVFFSNHRGS